MAYQVAFDLGEHENQQFLAEVRSFIVAIALLTTYSLSLFFQCKGLEFHQTSRVRRN